MFNSTPVRGFPDYLVTTNGSVMRQRDRALVPEQVNGYGNVFVQMYDPDGKRRSRSLSKIVAEAFCPRGTAQDTHIVFLDSNMWNCKADNLVWRTKTFASQYYRDIQRETKERPIRVIQDGESTFFRDTRSLLMTYGVCEAPLYLALNREGSGPNRTSVPPVMIDVFDM